MDLDKQIDVSSEAKVDVRLNEQGMAEISFRYKGKLGGVDLIGYTDAAMLVDKITDMIPGDWDDKLLDDLAKKLLAKKTGTDPQPAA